MRKAEAWAIQILNSRGRPLWVVTVWLCLLAKVVGFLSQNPISLARETRPDFAAF
jgi:hypothetical protein